MWCQKGKNENVLVTAQMIILLHLSARWWKRISSRVVFLTYTILFHRMHMWSLLVTICTNVVWCFSDQQNMQSASSSVASLVQQLPKHKTLWRDSAKMLQTHECTCVLWYSKSQNFCGRQRMLQTVMLRVYWSLLQILKELFWKQLSTLIRRNYWTACDFTLVM